MDRKQWKRLQRRKRQRKGRKRLLIGAIATVSLVTGIAFRGSASSSPGQTPQTPTLAPTTAITTAQTLPEVSRGPKFPTMMPEILTPPAEPEKGKLLQADLDAKTQWAIFEECEKDPVLFCLVMAIAEQETGYDCSAIGDGGNSLGMMQINTPWHTERMERLGVTDLEDPVQCARVAIDILREITSLYGYGTASHEQCMAYNMGANGAKKAMNAGYTSSKYSRKVLEIFQEYIKEMEVGE